MALAEGQFVAKPNVFSLARAVQGLEAFHTRGLNNPVQVSSEAEHLRG
jgi:hypothetical protein